MNEIIACGVPRSGSTLIWQILHRILPEKVIKAHPASWTPIPCRLIVGSIRHPYDTAASRFRTRIVGDAGDGSQETVQGTKIGLQAELKGMDANFKALKQLMNEYQDKVIVLRYEEFFENFDVIFAAIQDKLDAHIPHALRKTIKRECSFESNRKRTLQLNPGGEKIDKMGVSHVAVGIPGGWKSIIPFWGYELMKEWCDPLCKEWGYEI